MDILFILSLCLNQTLRVGMVNNLISPDLGNIKACLAAPKLSLTMARNASCRRHPTPTTRALPTSCLCSVPLTQSRQAACAIDCMPQGLRRPAQPGHKRSHRCVYSVHKGVNSSRYDLFRLFRHQCACTSTGRPECRCESTTGW